MLIRHHQGITPRDHPFEIPSLVKRELRSIILVKEIFMSLCLNGHLEVLIFKTSVQGDKQLEKPLVKLAYQRQPPYLRIWSNAKMMKK
ncbi:hypothetical protein VIGAN_09140800 [Vigna angularis var. angularis]|uniref:Uncharacterized protein n=1 Tax=Vigna angularis var. angularis TaxID=157739 RepID=A0A0S3SYL9_PHAAN|nr:hypothetical protein VIGAN_09140800 [Vigna angularis var. angularis]